MMQPTIFDPIFQPFPFNKYYYNNIILDGIKGINETSDKDDESSDKDEETIDKDESSDKDEETSDKDEETSDKGVESIDKGVETKDIVEKTRNVEQIKYSKEIEEENFNKQYLLNPLSVIIKLSILSFKPIGTKIHIQNNMIYLQEPGIFQSITRYIFKSNKSQLQYFYYPIKISCNKYLTKEFIKKYPKIKFIFITAKYGIENLMKTYSSCAMTTLCLKYYHVIISSYLDQSLDNHIFKESDTFRLINMNPINEFYMDKLLEKLDNQWISSKLIIILDLINFLLNNDNENNINNIKSLELILNNIDEETQKIIKNFIINL
jgi:hypothetical protein